MKGHRIHLRNGGTIEVLERCVVNRFRAGVAHELFAVSREDQEATARALGYPDVDAMTRDHDALHALLADMLGLAWSYSLHKATGWLPPEEDDAAVYEEAAVLALQAYLVHLGITAVELARRNGYKVDEI